MKLQQRELTKVAENELGVLSALSFISLISWIFIIFCMKLQQREG